MGLHFVSYSRRDAHDFADWLYDALWETAPETQPWMDRRDVILGYAFDEQLEEAISRCDTLLFVVSRDARNSKVCQDELQRADQLAKPIIPLRIHADVELPMMLGRLTFIDFAGERSSARLAELREHLQRLASPAGELQRLKAQCRRLERDLLDAEGAEHQNLLQRLADRQRQLDELTRVVTKPEEVARARRAEIDAGMALEVQSRSASLRQDPDFVDWLSRKLASQPEFRGRTDEIERLSSYIQDDGVQIVAVTGPEGSGKTWMVSRLLDELRSYPHATGVDAVVHLSTHKGIPVSGDVLIDELRRVLPNDPEQPPGDMDLPLVQKLDVLLVRLGGTRVILTIDGLEELLDKSHELQPHDLDEVLRFMALRRHHRVTVVLVSRVRPEPLLRRLPGRSREVVIAAGLPLGKARDLLRALDADGAYGVQGAPRALLDRAYALTNGHPRALELLYGNLTLPDSRYASLEQLLDAATIVPSDKVLDFLVSQMFQDLDPLAWNIVQALAVYNQPVSRGAVRDLLEPYIANRPIESAIQRLLRARLIRQGGELLSLFAPDAKRVFELIPQGEPADRKHESPPLTRTALLHRATTYFARTRPSEVHGLEDLHAHFAEADLLLRGEEYERALRLISDIEEQYLGRWGYSQILILHREVLKKNLANDWHRLVNLSALGRAHKLGNRLNDALECYAEALHLAKLLNRIDAEKKLYVNLASVQLLRGRLHEAFDYYRRSLAMAREHDQPAEEANPLTGLAECYARTGALPRALQHAGEALSIAQAHDNLDLTGRLLEMIGRWRGQLGQTLAAVECLRNGLRLAEARGNRWLQARFLDAMAEVHIDQAHVARATRLAAQAVELGRQINSPEIQREAGFTVAVAQLCAGDPQAALAAVDMACTFRRPGQAPFLLALRGIVLLRQEDAPEADQAFFAALGEAHAIHEKQRNGRYRDFALLDLEGVALCGLAVSRQQENSVEQAAQVFREARNVTRAPGIVARVLRLLSELDELAGPDVLKVALRAASGETDLLAEQYRGSSS
jgi:tetratricopeptide (TPR) repeat protein